MLSSSVGDELSVQTPALKRDSDTDDDAHRILAILGTTDTEDQASPNEG